MNSVGILCEEIGIWKAAAKRILEVLPVMEEVQRQYQLLCSDENTFFQENDKAENAPLRYLALFAGFASLCRREYQKRGLDNQVFTETMHDIARWEEAYHEKTGMIGIDEQRWLSRHIRLKLFQLGELQFEPLHSVTFQLPEEMRNLMILNVHIPKGAKLDDRGAAYQKALNFFGVEKALAVCSSWLLSPWIGEDMGRDSRIAAFQSEFTIAKLLPDSRQAEERLFGPLQEDPALYDAHTRLQVMAKKRLLKGEKLPAACGYQMISL